MDKEMVLAMAHEMMGVAEDIRKSGEEVEMMFAFWIPESNQIRLLPGATIWGGKSQMAAHVRHLSDTLGAKIVFTITEGWTGTNPDILPSKDPERQEAILVNASGQGVSLLLTRPIHEDGTLGEVTVLDGHIEGSFSNLSNREMMN